MTQRPLIDLPPGGERPRCQKCGKPTENMGDLWCNACEEPLIEAGIRHRAQVAFNRQENPASPGWVRGDKRRTLEELIVNEREKASKANAKRLSSKR